MRRKIKAGLTSLSLSVIVYDTASITGGGLSGLTHTTSGLVLEYRRKGQSSWTQLGVGTGLVSKTLGNYISGGIVANGSRAGRYEIDIPAAAIAAGARMVEICLRGAANMHPVDIEIELDAVDYQTDAFGALKPTTAGRTLDVSAGGEAGIDLANVGSPTTTLNLSGTTIKTATDIEADTQDIQNRIPSGLVDGRMAAIAQVVGDKTGYKLASDGLSLVTSWTVAITGNITGNVTGSVGSISGVTFPANFGSLGIDSGGAISEVILVYELDSGALTANGAGDPIAGIVWNALTTTIYTDQSFGDRILVSNNNTREISVTGSGHIASVLHDAEPNSIPEDAFQAGALSARVLASDAVGEVVDGVWDEATSGHTTAGTTGKALIDSGAAGNPWSTDLATGYSGTQAGNILNSVKSQTDLIQAGGTVTVSTPVTASGQLASPLIIGDDYLNANGRAFSWTVALPSGFVAATATCKFGMRYEDDQGVNSFIQSGTVIDAGSGNVTLRFDVAKAVTGLLRPGWYDWSVEIASASGAEITRVKSGKNAEWQEKQT